MRCPNCNCDVPEGSLFCPECGQKLEGVNGSQAENSGETYNDQQQDAEDVYGDQQRNKEAQQSQPRKENVEKSQHQIGQGGDPQVIIPLLFHTFTSWISITDAGHSLAHLPQPTHLSSWICACRPWLISRAPMGQTFTQHPQATQSWRATNAFLFLRGNAMLIPPCVWMR